MRKIYTYEIVQNFIESSDAKLKNKFKNILAYISYEKNELREPYVRHISQNRFKGLYEVRLKASGTMARVVFLKHNENIILLSSNRNQILQRNYSFRKAQNINLDNILSLALKLITTKYINQTSHL